MTRRKATRRDGGRPRPPRVEIPPEINQRFMALIDMIGRTGASDYRVEHTLPANGPIAWVAVATYNGGKVHAAGGDITPWLATQALAERLLDGGTCTHCHRPTSIEAWKADLNDEYGVVVDVAGGIAFDPCWQRYDPELRKYRRSCEGDT